MDADDQNPQNETTHLRDEVRRLNARVEELERVHPMLNKSPEERRKYFLVYCLVMIVIFIITAALIQALR